MCLIGANGSARGLGGLNMRIQRLARHPRGEVYQQQPFETTSGLDADAVEAASATPNAPSLAAATAIELPSAELETAKVNGRRRP